MYRSPVMYWSLQIQTWGPCFLTTVITFKINLSSSNSAHYSQIPLLCFCCVACIIIFHTTQFTYIFVCLLPWNVCRFLCTAVSQCFLLHSRCSIKVYWMNVLSLLKCIESIECIESITHVTWVILKINLCVSIPGKLLGSIYSIRSNQKYIHLMALKFFPL